MEEGIVAGGGVALLQAGAEAVAGRRVDRRLFLTTEGVVADKPEKEKAPRAPPAPVTWTSDP